MFFSVGVLACIAVAASCRDPTQITLRITTGEKCSDLTGIQIVVGPSADVTQSRFKERFSAAVTHACSADGAINVIGTLVVTPGASGGTVVVSAGVNAPGSPGPDPADCFDDKVSKQCIIARRSFSFIDHASLTLPIDLDPLCIGKACEPASTCFKGACVNANVECQDSTCLLPQQTGNGSGSGSDASSSDGAYDADLVDVSDAMSASDTGTTSDASRRDAASDARDFGDASDGGVSGGGTYDAGIPPKCFMVVGTCSVSFGSLYQKHSCDGSPDVSIDCCYCTCTTSDKIVSCPLGAMPGTSCLPQQSCP